MSTLGPLQKLARTFVASGALNRISTLPVPSTRGYSAPHTLVDAGLKSPDYAFGQERIPMVSASATRAADGSAVHLSLANTSPAQAVTLTVKLAGLTPKSVAGRVLTATAMNAHNTFEASDAVQPATFSGATLEGDRLEVKLPAKSVVVLTLK
jgi:alpha-N-arabinofuranosidase